MLIHNSVDCMILHLYFTLYINDMATYNFVVECLIKNKKSRIFDKVLWSYVKDNIEFGYYFSLKSFSVVSYVGNLPNDINKIKIAVIKDMKDKIKVIDNVIEFYRLNKDIINF